MTLLAPALALAHGGWHVFPVNAATKAPITANGFKAATTDQATVESWWYAHPDAGIGVSCDPTGLFVVDVDVSSGLRTPNEAYLRFNLPLTQVVRTPSGGFHLYYRGSGPSTVSRVAKGVDTRGVGGYVVAPPTPGYRADQQCQIVPVPDAFLSLCGGGVNPGPTERLKLDSILNGLQEGTRQDGLFRYACRLEAKGLEVWEGHYIMAALADICDPPFPQDEIVRMVDRVWATYRRDG